MKYSNEGVPNGLIDFLSNSEFFEVWVCDENSECQYSFNSEYLDFQANNIKKDLSEKSKDILISALFYDFEKGGDASRCWTPHHGIKAIFDGKPIEIAVCYMCGWFRGQILDERFYGTFPSEEQSQSKAIFDEIFNEK